nr:alpha/beta fold hydrolase [Prosthecobacter sp.]
MHGLNGTPFEMRALADALYARGYTVSVPQLAGHCGTFDDLRKTCWRDWARSAENALLDLEKRCATIIVGGLSAGAILSLYLASQHPLLVNAIALYAPTLWLSGWAIPWYARIFRLVHMRSFANLIPFPDLPTHGIKDPEIRDKVQSAILSGDSAIAGTASTPGSSVLEHRRLVNSVLRRLNVITQPTLIIHSREDDYAGPDNAAYLIRHLRSEVETLTLNDSYHIITSDRQLPRVIEKSLEFFARISCENAEAYQPPCITRAPTAD